MCGELRGKLADQSGCGCGATRAEVIINVLDPSGLAMDNPNEVGSASLPSDVLVDLTGGTCGTFFRNRNDVDEGFERTALPEIFTFWDSRRKSSMRNFTS